MHLHCRLNRYAVLLNENYLCFLYCGSKCNSKYMYMDSFIIKSVPCSWKKQVYIFFVEIQVRMKPYRACRIVVACAVLHNICVSLGQPEKEQEPDQEDIQPQQVPYQGQQDGRGIRDYVTIIIIYMVGKFHVEWDLQTVFKPYRYRRTTNHVTIYRLPQF